MVTKSLRVGFEERDFLLLLSLAIVFHTLVHLEFEVVEGTDATKVDSWRSSTASWLSPYRVEFSSM